MKQKRSNKILLPEGGILGEKFNLMDIVLLDNDYKVTVISQRPLRNFTKIFDGDKTMEVATSRLTK